MEHKATTLTALMILAGLATVTTAPTAAADDNCSGSDWGWGWEYPSCEFECNAGETLYVAMSQQDPDYVEGRAECGTASAECTGDYGKCSWRGVTPAPKNRGATCDGSAYSSGTTDAHIQCGSGDADAISEVQAILSNVEYSVDVSCGGLGPLLNGVGGSWRVVHINRLQGVFISSEGCAEFEPVVTMEEDGRTTHYSLT